MSDRRGPARPPRVAGLRRRAGAEEGVEPLAGAEATVAAAQPGDPVDLTKPTDADSGPESAPLREQARALSADEHAGVDADADADADADDDEGAAAPVGPRRRSRAALVVVTLVGVLLVAAAVSLALVLQRQDAVGAARADALSAARDAAPKVLSYDYRRLDADFAAATAVTTGKFRTDYERTSSTVVRPLAVEVQGVVQATVVGAGVVESSPTRVELVMFVNQVTVSSKIQGTKLDQNRVSVTMSKVGDAWLISDVEAL